MDKKTDAKKVEDRRPPKATFAELKQRAAVAEKQAAESTRQAKEAQAQVEALQAEVAGLKASAMRKESRFAGLSATAWAGMAAFATAFGIGILVGQAIEQTRVEAQQTLISAQQIQLQNAKKEARELLQEEYQKQFKKQSLAYYELAVQLAKCQGKPPPAPPEPHGSR